MTKKWNRKDDLVGINAWISESLADVHRPDLFVCEYELDGMGFPCLMCVNRSHPAEDPSCPCLGCCFYQH